MKVVKYVLLLGTALFMLAGCKPALSPTNPGNSGENTSGTGNPGNTGNGNNQGNEGNTGNGEGAGDPEGPGEENLNPTLYASRAANLDYIFSTESVGKVTITMKRSEWNQMLKNFDYFYKNENCVKISRFEYEKDGKKWDLNKGGGIRLRGNTSRFRPQGKDTPDDKTGHRQMNADWSSGYYNYAATCSDDDYRQSHFKVDFEEFLEEGDEQKLAGCMKGVALKRMDGSCTKEIFCYDLFHRFGIWTAPRASHTRVFFKFIEDIDADGSKIDDDSGCNVTEINYGVYEMFEEVNKQSLKARDKDENKASNAWKNSKGNLWKCGGGDLTGAYTNSKGEAVTMFAEKVEITEFDNDGNPTAFVWQSPTYDLKTNKDDVDGAAAELREFITELNALPNVSSDADTTSINAIKAFYEKWMDIDFFLKTYAINILVGMDDDYWGNANNYYLYFADTPNNGRKVYFIPFDYDNTLGGSIKGEHSKGEKEGIEQNPLDWGRGANRPLMDKLLQVPEYRQLFKDLLIEVSSSDNEWNFEKCSQRWYGYWNMVGPYLNSPDLSDQICTKGYWDNVYKPSGYSLVTQSNNLYDHTRACFMAYIREPGEKMTFNLNGGNINGDTDSVEVDFPDYSTTLGSLIQSPKKDGYIFTGWTRTKDGEDYQSEPDAYTLYARWKSLSEITDLFIYELEPGMDGYKDGYEGIQIRILNPPALYSSSNTSGARVRHIYINGIKIADVSNSDQVVATTWGFPYTVAGENYNVQIKYLKEDYNTTHSVSNDVTIKATSGKGKFSLETDVVNFNVTDNIITFSPAEPEIYVAGERISSTYNPGFFQATFYENGWSASAYPSINDYKLDSFNVLNKVGRYIAGTIGTQLRYIVHSTDEFGEYRLEINVSGNTFQFTDNDEDVGPKIEYVAEAGTNGVILKMPVDEIPLNAYTRRIYMNNRLVSDIRSYDDAPRTLVWSEDWYYPYVEPGKKYTFKVDYLDEGWKVIFSRQTSRITPVSGKGEIGVQVMPVYEVKDNILTWTTQPVMKIGDTIVSEDLFTSDMSYNMNLNTTGWGWCTSKDEYTYRLSSFNVKEHCEDKNNGNLGTALSNDCFMALNFRVGSNYDLLKYPYGEYVYEVLNDSSKMNFTLK